MAMDQVDRVIISELIRNGRISYRRIGDIIGYTIMGAKRRVERLLSRGIVRVTAELNVEKLGLYTALILLEFEDREALRKCLERFTECPRVVNFFTLLAGYNLAALVIAEDKDTLESESTEKCSLRSMPGVRRSEFYLIGTVHYAPYLRLRLHLVTRDREVAPCGVNCGDCERYQATKCVGCPATRHYRGPL